MQYQAGKWWEFIQYQILQAITKNCTSDSKEND